MESLTLRYDPMGNSPRWRIRQSSNLKLKLKLELGNFFSYQKGFDKISRVTFYHPLYFHCLIFEEEEKTHKRDSSAKFFF